MTHTPAQTKHHAIPNQNGTLEVVCGCMFAGKTEALIDRVTTAPRDTTRVFKHAIDDRYDARQVVSHCRRTCPAVSVNNAESISSEVSADIRFVAIDEAHFFDASLVTVCQSLVARGLEVIVTGLDRDCWGNPFDVITRLCQSADTVIVKTGRCARCGATSTRTQRLIPIVGKNLVGGAEAFEPRCTQCWTPPPGSSQTTLRASNTGP